MPGTTGTGIDVAVLSRTTVPSSLNGMIGASASARSFRACQWRCTVRHTPARHVLGDRPVNGAARTRPTRRVLVPAVRAVLSASAAGVRR